MTTTIADIAHWFKEGVRKKATHLIVVCDTFDHEDCPVYVMPGEDARAKAAEYGRKDMQRVMEVYHLGTDMDSQLVPGKLVLNYDPPVPAKAPKLTVIKGGKSSTPSPKKRKKR